MNFHHRGAIGDILYALPTIIAFGGGSIYTDFKKIYFFAKPLMDLQPYIKEFVLWESKPFEKIDINLDAFRIVASKAILSEQIKHLAVSHAETFKVDIDLTKPWLEGVEPNYQADIILGWTPRYHDKKEIDYNLLKPYANRILCVGKGRDIRGFKEETGLDFAYYECDRSALKMAQLIKGCKLFIGTQSAPFAMAESMKVPRVLEVYYKQDNCRPYGPDGYTYLTEEVLEEYCGRP
ncbi:MAG: hypothetical protein ACXADW_10850 [Candidatus Hodarchaeales archaeon]|jgi:hypothetical protein